MNYFPERRHDLVPHLVIEYSKDALDRGSVTQLMELIFAAAWQTGIMKSEDVKVRARGYDDFLVAGKRDSFVHLSVYLLAGRTPEQKVELSTRLRQTMVDQCPDVTSLSVDIRDMDPDAYKKRLK
jgi:5-carboxymethyl-2-hydroxymuconate isomerase